MAENSKIQWTHHTFNPWRGCARVSPGCVHCYAETLSKRNPKTLGTWGVDGTRVVASPSMWQQPVKWDTAAKLAGERHRVFCASLADVGEDRPDLVEPRKRLSDLIFRTSNLDWLLLTKRPENMTRLFDADTLKRCWVGSTAEDQPRYDQRVGKLLRIEAAVLFWSMEPLLSGIDLRLGGMSLPDYSEHDPLRRLDWVIVGCEQLQGGRVGRNAGEYERHARHILSQCSAAGVPAFHKQMPVDGKVSGEPHQWSSEYRIRQFPIGR